MEQLHTCPTCEKPGFTEKGLKAHKCKGLKAENVEVVNAAEILAAAKEGLEVQRELLTTHLAVFEARTLGNKLKLGLHCLKAFVVFTHNPGKGGRPKKLSQRDSISAEPQSFDAWLTKEVPWLKRPVAYKYMTALKGLSLDERATEEQVDFTLETLRDSNMQAELPAPSLKSLTDAAVEAVAAPALPAPPPEQQEFTFLKNSLSHFREEAEKLLSIKEDLKHQPEMHKAACARAYHILSELTGTQWAPSDEADELASIDPDTISL